MIIIVTPEAEKQYDKLPKTEQKKVRKKMGLLAINEKVGKKLLGAFSEVYSLRAWPYRILHYINQSQNTIYIVTIAHRQGVHNA